MSRDQGHNRQIVALFISLSIHVAAAAIVMWAGVQTLHLGGQEQRSVTTDAEPSQEPPNAVPARLPERDGTDQIATVPARRSAQGAPESARARGWLDHLWQSTIFAAAAGLLTLAFRRNGAHVRYWLWFGASVKFLIPFPILPTLHHPSWVPSVPGVAIVGVWACGFAAVAFTRLRIWRRLRAVVRASSPLAFPFVSLPPRTEIRSAPCVMEPGVVGWRDAVLMMPADIDRHLTQPQLATIVAHELCHVRRRDNLTGAFHMVVESIFWFHPMVWWIGARLVDERERACDEHVMRTFEQPQLYARAILNVCKRYLVSPIVCVSGVGGSAIRKRIDAILRNEVGEPVGPLKKALLSSAIVALVIIPAGASALSRSGPNAQAGPQPADITVDAAARDAVIDRALKALNESYVFPDVAKKMDDAIRARQQGKEYDAIASGRQFAQLLTEHLREVSGDLHLSVNLIPQGPPPPPPPGAGGIAQTLEERQRTLAGQRNFGFARVERLAGNIGYLDLRGFMAPAVAGETATAAMTFLSSTDAVIFDLRENGGGDPSMVAFLTSYLLGPRAVHLNDFYSRPTNETRQSWTLPYVPGRRLTEADVYILTSSRTFSGAEEFTYNLKHLKRATIVGEATRGAAHTVEGRRINANFAIAVPTGRPINPVTKTNWEGVGVKPDVAVSPERALTTAHLMALEKQERRLTADTPGLRQEVMNAIATLRKELGAAAASIPSADDVQPVPASRADEDFESGTLANWRIDQRGSGGWFIYSEGKTSPDPARSDSGFPFDVPAPPQGKFAAVTDQNAPGRFILYRDVTLDGRYRLHLTPFYVNLGRRFSGATISSRNTINDEQHYRIDIVASSAPVDSVASEHVLVSIFETRPGDPARRVPTEVTVDLSRWEGRTVRLRLAVGENQAPLRGGVDNIRFERIERE